MPHVQGSQTSKKRNSHSKGEIAKVMRTEIARDDLRTAFAGRENRGPAGSKANSQHSTSVKSRDTKNSRKKTPVR